MPTNQVRASHILVSSLDKANSIVSELKAGKGFEELAKKHSTCPSGQRGGDLGFFGKGMMVPDFEKAAFALEPGMVSSPVKTQFGYHLIKVTGKK